MIEQTMLPSSNKLFGFEEMLCNLDGMVLSRRPNWNKRTQSSSRGIFEIYLKGCLACHKTVAVVNSIIGFNCFQFGEFFFFRRLILIFHSKLDQIYSYKKLVSNLVLSNKHSRQKQVFKFGFLHAYFNRTLVLILVFPYTDSHQKFVYFLHHDFEKKKMPPRYFGLTTL